MRASVRRLAHWLMPPALVLMIVWLGLAGWRGDPRVPVVANGDALFYLDQSKSTLDHGWWWTNPSIGLPEGYVPLVFGQTTNVDQAMVWLVGWFTRDVGLAVNTVWLLMLALASVTTTWGLRRMGVSPLGAGSAGGLFALAPFAFYRHIAHLNLAMYLVPLPSTVALVLATAARDAVWRRKDVVILAGVCALVGFNYIYNAFFGAAVICAGLVIGYGRTRAVSVLRLGAGCLGALMLATFLNMLPTVLAWREHGQPPGTTHLTLESEYYGLKIRHLVSPVDGHWFPPFRAWLAAETRASYTLVTEANTTRLGAIAAAGWLALMATLVIPVRRDPERERDPIPAVARLSAVAVLLGTIGGVGSLISLVSPEIRAYNRIAPFIAFFALAGVAVWIDRLTASHPARVRLAGWLLGLAVGVSDQWTPISRLASNRPMHAARWHDVAAFVSDLEKRLPVGAMVFQFPIRPFPGDPGIEKMGVYAHFEPYLVSHQLRWSYPVITPKQAVWEQGIRRPVEEWPAWLAKAGFKAILIDRFGLPDLGDGV